MGRALVWRGRLDAEMATEAQFEIWVDSVGEWRWRFRAAGNAVTVASGEGYQAQRDCLRAVEVLRQQSASARMEFLPVVSKNALSSGLMTGRRGLLG